ncbi:MFS transporter [Candidatus Bathyarchaeota archaeon]|nr:MFS transporter [Candidatus Bathyarchaeota archaeon]
MNQRFTVQLSTALAFGPTGIIWAFLPIHLRLLHASFLLISLLSLIPAVETILLSPIWGGILDRTGKGKRILLFSFLAQAIGFSTFPFLSNPIGFVLVVSLIGLFSSSFIPVYASIATFSSQQYGRAIGRFWVSASLGYASVTLLGGFLYEYLPVITLFILGALYGFSGCIVVFLASSRSLTLATSAERPRGYWGLLRQPRIAVLCLLSVGVLVSASAFNNFFTVYLVDTLNGSRLIAGLAATATTVLGAVAYKFVGPLNDRIGRKPVFLLGAAGYGAYYTILYFVTNVAVVTFLWILPIYPLAQSASATLMSDYTSTADRGKGLGLLESALSLGGGLGPLAGGLIADALQLQAVILFSLAIALATLTSTQLFLRESPRATVEIPVKGRISAQ